MKTIGTNPQQPLVMVDDNIDDIAIARECYADADISNPFLCLNGGQELIDYLRSVDEGQSMMPALVLLDINMPGMSGFEALRKIRRQEQFNVVPIIMMLTNSDNPRDIEVSRMFGANGFQTKFSDISRYIGFFQSLADGQLPSAAGAAAA